MARGRNDLKVPLKHGQRRGLNCYQDLRLPKLHNNALKVEYNSSKQLFRTGQMKKVTIGGQTNGQVLTKKAPADYVLVRNV